MNVSIEPMVQGLAPAVLGPAYIRQGLARPRSPSKPTVTAGDAAPYAGSTAFESWLEASADWVLIKTRGSYATHIPGILTTRATGFWSVPAI